MAPPPPYAAGRRSEIATGCAYSNAAGPNFRASVQRTVDLAQGYAFEMRPFDADDGQRQLQAGRDSWSARTVQYEL